MIGLILATCSVILKLLLPCGLLTRLFFYIVKHSQHYKVRVVLLSVITCIINVMTVKLS